MKRRVFAGLSGLMLVAVPTAAHANSGSQDTAAEDGVYQVADVKDLPDIGDDVATWLAQHKRPQALRAEPATLTEKGEYWGARHGKTYRSDQTYAKRHQGVAAGQGNVTIASCQTELGNREDSAVIDHYNFCAIKKSGHFFKKDGKVVAKAKFDVVIAGTGAEGSRTNTMQAAIRNYKITEGTPNSNKTFGIYWKTAGYSGSDGSNAACTVAGENTKYLTRDQWNAGATATVTVSSTRAQGYSRDGVSRCVIQPNTHVPQDIGAGDIKVTETGVRQDSASYVGAAASAAIFDRVVPVMHYSRSSTAHGEVAQHIYDAQTKPATTWPTHDGKSIPGSIASGKRLMRLYKDWDANATQAYKDNTKAKNDACADLQRADGEDCDEYPFASSWEGAGAGDGNFSVRYVNDSQNRSAGASLVAWYNSDRILHFDQFYVSIS
ncbi:NucA/NucB deoxyribonuclease domain-containing protein [Streptomyces sp. MCA2]|uniref:NucA/NucB deoxyribonuclease domain-containing protein n=1 Tax=Streptomyces sp. MCA2 TaxID=2944805 RepID=UPI0020203967|nr:NucA/NucB deoxyribonuclease domain-containing protein [Streptomyces sp. MCA2]MCL7496076.1 NucA/NucB deoxyribonuclease domain-containing protein [Streptomyces sp. MCA2]